jgi:hypothetical protein
MDNDMSRLTEFYAKLANVEDLESLPSVEKEELMLDTVKAGLLHSLFYAPKGKRKGTPAAWLYVEWIHPWARKVITGILDNGEADVRELNKVAMAYKWLPEKLILDKAANRVVPVHTMNGIAYDGLMEVIRQRPFPFQRCQQCNKIFSPDRNQRYCSKACSTKSLQPWKRKYMKGYMQERRRAGGKRK